MRLLRFMAKLGPGLGYRYWKADRYYREHPEAVLRLIDNCERNAADLTLGICDEERELLRQFAKDCRTSHARYMCGLAYSPLANRRLND